MSPDNSYEIEALPELAKIIQKHLPQHLREVFDRKLGYLSENLHHPSLNTKSYNVSSKALKALGVDEVWEFYINRHDYRCIFYVIHEGKRIIIADVGNHDRIKKRYG